MNDARNPTQDPKQDIDPEVCDIQMNDDRWRKRDNNRPEPIPRSSRIGVRSAGGRVCLLTQEDGQRWDKAVGASVSVSDGSE